MTPFEQAVPVPSPLTAEDIARVVDGVVNDENLKHAQASLDRINAEVAESMVWVNDLYQVFIRRVPEDDHGFPYPVLHLSIKRLDKETTHDWRHLQIIKNELVGPEHEAIELYPAESRLVDTANQYHLWVLGVPGVKFPIGWHTRMVNEESLGGSKQRPFEEP